MANAIRLARHRAKRRLHHIFSGDGFAVIMALDHARIGSTQGLERATEAVSSVVEGGVDAILRTFGMARAVAGVLGGAG